MFDEKVSLADKMALGYLFGIFGVLTYEVFGINKFMYFWVLGGLILVGVIGLIEIIKQGSKI